MVRPIKGRTGNSPGKMKNIEHYKHIPLKRITSLRILGYLVLLTGPCLFVYKHPDNTLFSFFIEALLILFGLVILKDCWVSQEYWRGQQDID
jgi:hypothetical protein